MKKLRVVASTVSRVLKHFNSDKPCAVLSAYMDRDPETNVPVTLEQNKEAQFQLRQRLDHAGYGSVPLRSKLKYPDGKLSEEESFCVPNMPFSQAVRWGRDLKQFSILVKDEQGNFGEVYTTDTGGKKVGEWKQIFNKDNTEISEKDFAGAFSQVNRGNGNAVNKRIKLSYLAETWTRGILPVASITTLEVVHFVFVGE